MCLTVAPASKITIANGKQTKPKINRKKIISKTEYVHVGTHCPMKVGRPPERSVPRLLELQHQPTKVSVPNRKKFTYKNLSCSGLDVMGREHIKPLPHHPMRTGAGIMEADDRQVTTVFTVQPSFHQWHSTNPVS